MDRLAKAAATIPGKIEAFSVDIREENSLAGLFAAIGEFDHLATPGGEAAGGPFLDLDLRKARQAFDSKFWGQYMAAKHGAPSIRSGGSITLISGSNSQRPLPGAAVRAAINNAVEGLAPRLYPIQSREALIMIRDITEQAKLNEMKSDFINRGSHELRTPLTAAMLMTELILEGGSPEELDEYWRTLRSELNRQKILIDRLLIAGRLESGMMKLEIAPLDLLPVLDESILAVKAIAGKREGSLLLEQPEQPVYSLGDKSGLQQVFINLINNAVKFSQAGKAVRISLSQDEEQIHVHIVDSGVGIPEDAKPYLFERFYRAKNVTIAEIPGSGIGLYIVKSIVDELGGSIQAKSVLNEGTTFIVSLKRAPVPLSA